MSDTRTLRIVVSGDSTDGRRAVQQTGREVEQTEKKVGRLRQAFDDLGPTVVAGIAGVGIMGGFQATIGAAVDLNETITKTKTIFKEQYPVIERWAENAETSMGQTTKAALDGAASFANFFKQVGIGGPKVAAMSKRFVELSADFASFANEEPAVVMDALLSATRGEYDALQRFVPTANAANIEMQALAATGKKSASQLTLAEKAQGLYNLVLKDGGDAIGDFARNADGAANQQRILTAKLQEQGAAIGDTLLPAYQGLLNGITSVGPVYAAAGIAALIFGNKIQQGATAARTGMTTYVASVKAAAATTAAAGGKMATLRAAFTSLGTSAAGAGRAMSGMMAAVGGPYGIIIAAATLGLGYFIQKQAEAAEKEKAHKQAIMDLTEQVRANNGVIDENIRKTAAKQLNDNGMLDTAKKLGLDTQELTTAYAQGGTALDNYRLKVLELQRVQAVSNVETTTGTRTTGMQRQEMYRNYEAYNQFIGKLGEVITVQQEAKTVQDKLNEATGAGATGNYHLNQSMKDMSEPGKKLTTILHDIKNGAQLSAGKVDELKKAWDDLMGAEQSQEEAVSAHEEALDSMNDTIEEARQKVREAEAAVKGKTGAEREAALATLAAAKESLTAAKNLDVQEESGRKARKAIADVAKASRDRMLADIAAGVPAAKALQDHNKRIAAHEKEAIKAGQSRTKVKELFDLYGKPPDDVQLALKVTGDKEAKAKLEARLVQQMALRNGITLENAHKQFRGLSTGGPVSGPGTSTSDQAGVYRLSDKEYVIQAESAHGKYGHSAMDDLNKGRIPADLIKNWRSISLDGRAGGGPVWNKRTKEAWPHPTRIDNLWVPTAAQAAKAVEGAPGVIGVGKIGGWRNMWKWLHDKFPSAVLTSSVRNTRTLSGNASLHNAGRAIDVVGPLRQMVMAITASYGKNVTELISPYTSLNRWHGKPHAYSRAVQAQHGAFGNNAHVHWAMDNGGVLPPKSTTLITNATNRREYALTEDKLRNIAGIHIDNLNVTVHGDVSPQLAARIARDVRTELTKVANRNGGKSYLPAK